MDTKSLTDLHTPQNPLAGPIWQFYKDVPSYTNPNDLYAAVARLIAGVAHTEVSAVVLIDRKTNEITIPAAWTDNVEILHRLRSIRLPVDKSIHLDLLNLDEPSVENNFKDSSGGFQKSDPFAFDYIANRLVVPLQTDSEKIGFLWTINKSDGNFNANDVEKLSIIAVATIFGIEAISLRSLQCQSGPSVDAFNQAKDHIIHHLSHALKTPIAVLIASISLLEKHLDKLPDKGWKKITERAHRNLKRLLRIEYEMEDILRKEGSAPSIHQGQGYAKGYNRSILHQDVNTDKLVTLEPED